VQFLKSLICWQGFDNRTRFSAIHLCCYLFFLFALFIFPVVLTAISLLVITLFFSYAIKRRINDAGIEKPWPLIAIPIFVLTGILILFIENNIALMLLALPIAFSAFLATYKSKHKREYILGYNGPVDLSAVMQNNAPRQHQSHRIEPVLSTGTNHSNFTKVNISEQNANISAASANTSVPSERQNTNQVDIGETVRAWIIEYKFLVIGAFIFCLIAIVATILIPNAEPQHETNLDSPIQDTKATEIVRLHPVNLPDNFTLMLSQYNGVIINWQADDTTKTNLWDITSAEGDNSCKEIRFNNGDKIRTNSVTVENGQDYFASFSPLDTTLMLKNIAFKGKFTLCDYTFSLKGSQAALGKHPIYAEIVEY